MGQIILGFRTPDEIQKPPAGKVNIFVDKNDGLAKMKFSDGSVKPIGFGSSSGGSIIKYHWADEAQKNAQTGMAFGDQGVREDLIGRPVYVWDQAGVWKEIYCLDNGANTISYEIPEYPNVHTLADALNIIFKTDLVVKYFNGGGVYELGTIIEQVPLSWEYNKQVTSQTISPEIGSLNPNTRDMVYNPREPIKEDVTFTLIGSDGASENSATTSIMFKNKRWWGTSLRNSMSSEIIRSLQSFEFADRREIEFTFDGAGKYLWYCYPSRFDEGLQEPVIWVNGLIYTSVQIFKVDILNARGYLETYTAIRSNKVLYGDNSSFVLQ